MRPTTKRNTSVVPLSRLWFERQFRAIARRVSYPSWRWKQTFGGHKNVNPMHTAVTMVDEAIAAARRAGQDIPFEVAAGPAFAWIAHIRAQYPLACGSLAELLERCERETRAQAEADVLQFRLVMDQDEATLEEAKEKIIAHVYAAEDVVMGIDQLLARRERVTDSYLRPAS